MVLQNSRLKNAGLGLGRCVDTILAHGSVSGALEGGMEIMNETEIRKRTGSLFASAIHSSASRILF